MGKNYVDFWACIILANIWVGRETSVAWLFLAMALVFGIINIIREELWDNDQS